MLKDLILSITNRCNLRCRMCDIPLAETEELETRVWERVIQEAAALGANTVVFSGGEPLLREDLCELISFAKKQKMAAFVTSNGILLDEKRAYELLRAGVDVVNISIEGPEEVHDHFRGKGSFARALSAIKNLRKYDVECTLASVVTAKNFKHLPFIVELARQHGVTTFKLQPFNRLFLNTEKKGEEFFLSEEDAPAFKETIKKVISLCQEYGIGTNPTKYLTEMSGHLVKKHSHGKSDCPALYLSCPVNAKGEIYPCWVLGGPAHALGSVKENSLSSIWSSARRSEIIERINKKGCPGCLMSCYDDNFGKQGLDEKISRNWGLLRREGPRGYFSSLATRWKKRWNFYASWRGDAQSAWRRIQGKLTRKNPPFGVEKKEKAIAIALEELRGVKRIFEQEIKKTAKRSGS